MQTSKHLFTIIGIAILACFLIYYPVFFADYAFTDEAHQLWFNNDGSNFIMFLNQGRLITGWLIDGAFGNMDSVSDIKWLRIFSFSSMVVFMVLYGVLSKKLFDDLKIDGKVWALSVVFIPCSLSAAIYVGWASCAEIFLATLAAFLSGYLLFRKVNSKETYLKVSTLTLAVSLFFAMCSLFTYQTAFGFFLLPFFLYFIKNKSAKIDRTIIIGVGFYIACYVVYYFLFRYSLKVYNVQPSTRATINIDPLGKLSFFFSYPLAQAFSFNFLYNARSILSQIFYPLVILFWMISLFIRIGKKNVGKIIGHILICFALLILTYLPLMISIENFASYRTMFALNFLVFVMVCDFVISFLRTNRLRNIVAALAGLIFCAVAFYNYHINFSKPLENEYAALRSYFMNNYEERTEAIFFVRPPMNLFKSAFGVNYYTDEFGYPSTEKDWTPEPLLKQLVFEKTKSREEAKQVLLDVSSATQSPAFSVTDTAAKVLIIDMQAVFNAYWKQRDKSKN
ncbi:glucosyltransferase domain-containing protein [Lacibacter sp. H375]|uniref:glucosyltransferase domain-containing protein n=1 Tax=Lacibacter sp. H375 TaxID=3133424 RepID=UPI0030C30C4A